MSLDGYKALSSCCVSLSLYVYNESNQNVTAGRHRGETVQGYRFEDLLAYIQKLDVANRQLDRRIVDLGGEELQKQKVLTNYEATLSDVLSSPAALPLFTEYMDR